MYSRKCLASKTKELEVWKYCTLCGNVFKNTFLKNHKTNLTNLSFFNKVILPLNDFKKNQKSLKFVSLKFKLN